MILREPKESKDKWNWQEYGPTTKTNEKDKQYDWDIPAVLTFDAGGNNKKCGGIVTI